MIEHLKWTAAHFAGAAALCALLTGPDAHAQSGLDAVLDLPREAESHRIAMREPIAPGEEKTIADVEGQGCLRHLWMTFSDADEKPLNGLALTLRIYFDGSETPHVEAPVAPFFGIHHGHPVRPIDSPLLQVTEESGFNAYFPMPYREGMRITLQNESEERQSVWFLADYHKYPAEILREARRFRAAHRRVNRAKGYSTPYHLGHGRGRGFLAGLSLGMRVLDRRDHWYHCGGDLLLLDGGRPRARVLSGIGGEDFFGSAWGMDVYSNGPIGSPYYDKHPGAYQDMPIIDFAAYRFFTADPVGFQESFHYDFGSLENDMSSVLYWYQEGPAVRFAESPTLEDRLAQTSVPEGKYDVPLSGEMVWRVIGPFSAVDRSEFERREAPEGSEDMSWTQPADFGQYREAAERPGIEPTFTKWTEGVRSKHGFVDLTPYNRPRLLRNGGLPTDVSAYASSVIHSDEAGVRRLRIGHDDWIRVWVEGKLVYDGVERSEFQTHEVDVALETGDNRILVKAANQPNSNFRAWVFLVDLLD